MDNNCDSTFNPPFFNSEDVELITKWEELENKELLTSINEIIMATEEQGAEQQMTGGGLVHLKYGLVPSRDDFPGPFHFQIRVHETRSVQNWAYSGLLNQLYIRMNKTILMEFRLSYEAWQHLGGRPYVSALPVYSTDANLNIPVNRCRVHMLEDDPTMEAHREEEVCLCRSFRCAGHVVRADDSADYLFDRKSRRHYVRVPLSPPQAGSDCVTVPYHFACKTSCEQGMSRRPILLIFTLEDANGEVYGRQKIGVKVCSCPRRDMNRHEDDYRREEQLTGGGGHGGGRSLGGGKRKKTEDHGPTPRSHGPPPYPANNNNHGPPPPSSQIKEEVNDPAFMSKEEMFTQIQRELTSIKKLIEGTKDTILVIENKVNQVVELVQKAI